MKQNLLFNQASALGKRLAMVLTMLLIVGVGQAWGAEATATLSFASTAQRDSQTTTKQVWSNDGITFTNNKGSSTTNVGNYSNPVRLYASSEVIVEHTSGKITQIVFVANSSAYATAMKNSIGTVSDATVSVSGSKVTVTFTNSVESFTVAKLTAQVRLNSLTVTYEEEVTCAEITPSLTYSSTTLEIGSTANPTLTDNTGDGTVTYSSDNLSVASVNVTTGVVTAEAAGTATITATIAANGEYCAGVATATIKVNEQSATIVLSEAGTENTVSGTFHKDESYTLPSSTDAKCGDKVLVGWSTIEIAETDTKPTSNYYDKGTSVSLKAGENKFYAVFATASKATGGTTTTSTTSSLSFANIAQRTSQTTSKQVWTNGGITFTNEKASSTTNVANYYNPVRLYSGSSITIEHTSSKITAIVFDCNSSSYANALKTSIGTIKDASVSVSSNKVTVTFTNETASFKVAKLSDQVRLDALSVTYNKTTTGGTTITYSDYTTQCTTETVVTLNPNGGTFDPEPDDWTKDGDNYKKEGVTSAIDLPTPTQKGYNFDGWYNGETKVNSPYDPSESVTLVAKWTVKQTQLSINVNTANHGSGSGFIVVATYGEALPNFNPCTPATGYTLNGYYTEATDGTKIIDKDGKLVNNVSDYTSADGKWASEAELLILYAQYIINTYTVEFDNQGHGTKPDDQTINHGGKVNNPGNLTANGFIFGGWYKESGCNNAWNFETDVVTSNITIYAKWTAKTATSLSWSADSYSATIDADNDFPTLSILPAEIKTEVTYSSSDETIATISADAQTITLLKEGTTTITATFIETDTHTGATDFYTLTVHPSNCRWVETEIGDIEPVDEVLVTMKLYNGDTYTLDHSKFASEYPPAVAIHVNGNEATFLSTFHNNSIWNISGNATDGYILRPNGDSRNALYCTATKYNVKVGTDTDNLFTIDGGYLKNKTHNVYVGVYSSSDWRHYPANTGNAIAGQTLKFYKRECLDASKVWVEGSLTNVTCDPQLPQQLAKEGSITLTFTAADGYELPNNVTVTNAAKNWDKANGTLTISNPTDNVLVTVAADKQHTITWNIAGDETLKTYVVEGNHVELPDLDDAPISCSDTYTTFVGWYTAASGMETSPSTEPQGEQVTTSTIPTDNTTYYAVWADAGEAADVVDVLNRELTGIEGTTYGEWSGKISNSNAVYAGQSAGGNESIQLRSNNSNSGIITTASGGKATKVDVTWNENTTSGRTLNIYGKNSAYDAATDLYSTSTQGTLLGTIICGTSTELTINGDYEYIGLRSASGAMYLDEIQIKWSAGSEPTGYISSCCQSPAVVKVTPADASLELDIDGTAYTKVNISQTDGGNGEFSANVDGSAKLEATNNATDNPYTLNFTATEVGEYIINGTFTDDAYDCPKYGSATINVVANPILQASAEALEFSPTCGQNSESQEVEINSRYLTSNSITATVATTSGSGKFTISTDNTTFGTSDLTLSGGTTTKVTDQIYLRYEAEEGETGVVAGTLTLKYGSTQQVINLTGTCTCSANVTITGAPIQITAAKGVWVEAATELTVTGTFLTTNADDNANVSIRAYTNNAAFQIKKGGVTGEGASKTASNNALALSGEINTADWTGSIGVVYKPTQANTTETATLTVEVYRHNGSAIYSTATYELEGRSLPEQFVIAVTNGSGDWFAVPADMVAPWGNACSGLGTFAPYPISVDNTSAPTIASDVPARAVYQAAARTGNVNTNPQTMSYKSVPLGGNYYLYGSSTSVDSDGNNTNIQNASFAASEKQKWFLDVVDWNTKQYNMHVHSSMTTNVLAYSTAGGANRVGQYGATAPTTKKSIYLLPINGTTCTYYAAPVVRVMAIDATNATIQFKNDRTTAYEISLDQNTWTDLAVTLIKDCSNSEEATLLEAQLPLATYRGKTVYIRAKVTSGTACQETGSFIVPNPTINRGETPWRYTGMAGQAFSDNSKSVTISDLWNPLSVSVVQQVTGSNIQASITPEGVVTVSMAAENATEGDHKAVLEFTSAGAETKQVGVVITLHNLALQEFDGGSYAFTDGTPKVFCENYIYEDIIAWKPEIHLSHALYMGGATISTTDQLNNTNFTLIDLNTGESLSFTKEVISGGIAKITLNATCRSKMVPGHTYRLSWENTNQVMTDENGLPYMDCHMDFVYSENCDAPTALPACPITNSGFTANWAPVADCTGDVTVDVYTKQNAVLQEYNFTTSGSTTINAWSQRGTTKWFIGGTGVQDKTTNGYEMLSTNGGYNVYSPQLSNWKSDITTDDEVKITLVGYNNRTDATTYALKLYVVENANMPTSAGKPTIFKTVTINGQSTNVYTLTLAASRVQSTGVFTIEGLSATDRFFITSSSSSSNCLLTSIKMESSAKTPVASKTVACNAGSAAFTGLSANTTYYYTVGDGNGNNSNEIEVTTYSGAPSLKYYSDEACTTEITETKVLGGEETTVYIKGTNISACELVPSVTTGYAYDDSGLSYTPSTGDVSGKIILTLTDPANTISGTLTIAGYPLDLISSDCPAGFNNMAKDATDVTSNSAQANWNSGLNFGDDPSGTLLLYENGEVFVELVENGDFETGSLTDGWSSSIHTGPSDGNKAFNDYELVDNSLYITDNAGCGTLANFHNMTLMYANYVTLKPGTYRMKAQVKVPEVSGNTDKEKIFAIGLVQSGLSVVAVSPKETVLSNNTYVEIIYEFELANKVTVCPAIGARQAAGEFLKFYIDNVSLMRIKCPGPGDLIREIPITDLGTGFEDIEGLKPNTEYTYVIKNVNDCESNEITFYTGQGNYMPMQVVEWKENSVVVMYTGSETNAIVMIGSNNPETVALTQQDVAIYELPITGLIEHPTERLYITIGEGFKAITIPYIISATKDEDDLTTNRDLARTSDIVILNEGKLNITKTGNAAYQYHDITIYGGGKMIVEGEVKIASLTMRIGAVVNRAHQALYPQLVLKGQITNSSRQINLDYLTTYDRYYALSVPYSVLTESIHYPADIYGDNLKTGNNASFALQWYDGEARASETRKGWTDLQEPATLAPYQGYTFWGAPRKVNGVRPTFGIHRIPMPVEDLTIKNNETSTQQINVYAHPAANAYDAGWNFIGNPYLAQYGNMEDGHTSGLLGMLTQNPETGVWEHTGNYRYITLTDDGKTYWQTPVSEAELYPFNTFFVQAGENGAVSFNASNRASLPARHYAAQQVTAKEITTGILLTGNDQTDRTGLLIADNFTEEYEFNADLSKFENSGINLYTIGKTGNLAYMAINQALAEQPIPVGYTAPAEGLYTIAFDEDRYNATDISALYLIDYDSNEKTNLLHTDYSFVTAAGTNNQRFALQVAFAPENATNVEWVGDATVQVGVEGNTLMLNNLPTDAAVHVFDALGRLMYHAPTVPTEMQLTLPTGYYLVRIADKQNAVVIKTVIP